MRVCGRLARTNASYRALRHLEPREGAAAFGRDVGQADQEAAAGDFDDGPDQSANCFASRAIKIFRSEPRQDDTTGKSPKVCPAPPQKIFRLTRRANQHYGSARLTR
jgi:hypothetical protein